MKTRKFRSWAAAAAGALAALALGAAASAQPALWKVTDDDSTVWLFGSVHLLDPQIDWTSERLDAAFAAADTVYFETDLSPAAQDEAQLLVPKYGFNGAGVTLTSRLSAQGRADFEAVLASIGMPLANFEALRPWLAGVVVGVRMIMADGGDPDAGVDRVLHARARDAGKTIKALETMEDQFAALARLDGAAEDAFFEASLQQILEQPNLLADTVDAWRVGDVATMDVLIAGALKRSPDAYAALITERNANWAEILKRDLAGSGEILVVVGAGHLLDADGVQALLAEAGYAVARE